MTVVLDAARLRVLSFNIWRNGGRSLAQTIDAIRASRADVVGLQECDPATARTIARQLSFAVVDDGRSNAILSRSPRIERVALTTDAWGGLGATIEWSADRRIHVFDAHLQWTSYGPYHLQDGRDDAFVVDEERRVRMPGLDELLSLMSPSIESGEPSFLVGDFNAPSHLDYASLAWPESIACYACGLYDSYRVLHPEHRVYPGGFAFDEPGLTWTPLSAEEQRGAFDRIDFIYYSAASGTTPLSSTCLDGENSVDPWPSDHRAVLSTFALP